MKIQLIFVGKEAEVIITNGFEGYSSFGGFYIFELCGSSVLHRPVFGET